jgi:soluble lytic murein transglycosylase-like protein
MLADVQRAARRSLFAAALFLTPCAHAQVLEIDAAGKVTTYSGPTIFRADGSTEAVRPSEPTVLRRTPAGPPPPTPVVVAQAAISADLSPELVEAVGWQESRWRAGQVSPAGAIGEMQLMPATARMLGVNPRDSGQNIMGGAIYLKSLMRRYDGDLVRALAAYNAGPAAVDRYGGMPPFRETRDYVDAILDRLSNRVSLSAQK